MSSIYDDTTSPYEEPMTGPLDPDGQYGPAGQGDEGGRHPVNITHLVMGVAFAGMVLIWALSVGGVVGGEHDRWLWPIPWLAAGVAGLAATVSPSRK